MVVEPGVWWKHDHVVIMWCCFAEALDTTNFMAVVHPFSNILSLHVVRPPALLANPANTFSQPRTALRTLFTGRSAQTTAISPSFFAPLWCLQSPTWTLWMYVLVYRDECCVMQPF